MTREELAARDEILLSQARDIAEAVIDGLVPAVRSVAWGVRYDPYRILRKTRDPDVFRLALVNIRIAVQPGESWSKCCNCSRLYLVGEHGSVVCSGECDAAYAST